MHKNIFGYSDPYSDIRTLLGRDHPMFLIKENQKKLDQPLKIERIELNKEIKSPIKGYKFYKATGIGNGYSGSVTDKRLYYGRKDLPLHCLQNKKDKFKAFINTQENFGQIIVVEQGVKSISKLKKNLKSLHKLVFEEMGVMVAVARGAPPIQDIGTWGADRRQEEVLWSHKKQIYIPRLCLLWCHLMEGMIPEVLVDQNAESDGLLWLGTKESIQKLDEDLVEEINTNMNEKIKWKL